MPARAFIAGCAGPRFSARESDFFRDANPWGLILFARNCVDKEQIRALVSDFREAVGRTDAPVLIDQEGGRVQRLKPPIWPGYPAPDVIAKLFDLNQETGKRAAWLQGRLIGEDLFELDISIDCIPCIDIRMAGAHEVIGDRSLGDTPDKVHELASAMVEGLSAAGVAPIMKHIPGHGRTTVDTHFDLPRVDATRGDLEITDFEPFRRLAALPMAMTAHLIYEAIDAARPATLSPVVVDAIIRGTIGFDGLLMSDDISMNALSGSLRTRASAAIKAGLDMTLHCNGDPTEMSDVASQSPVLSGRSAERAAAALVWSNRQETDIAEARLEFARILGANTLDGAQETVIA